MAGDQREDIAITFKGKTIVITPETSGREFGQKLIVTHLNDSVQILDGLVRVTGTAAQYILKEIQVAKSEQNRPKIDTYG